MSATDENKTTKYRRRFVQLQEEVNESWRSHWLELSEYLCPRKGRYLSTDDIDSDRKGDKVHAKIINGSVLDAVRTLAAGLQGGLTSPSRPWFRLAVPDEKMMEYTPVKEWLHNVRNIMLNVLQRSNFYGSIHNCYEELGTFGTNSMLIEEDYRSVVRFRPFTIGEYFLATGSDYRANALYRRFSMTARQMAEKFGKENLSDAAKTAFEQNRGENRFSVINAIQKNAEQDPAVDGPRGMEYESVYFEEKTSDPDKFLRRGGYRTRPFVAPRWGTTATETYGRSPGMECLGDVKMLQKMESKSLRALDKMVDPPMNAPTMMRKYGNPTVLPGGVNFVDVGSGQQSFSPAYQVNPDFQNMEYKIANVEKRIRRAFFNDLFVSILTQDKRMTATEVAERHEEKLMMLGPVLERLQSELLDVIVERVFDILLTMQLLPPAPQELEGMAVRIEYISLLAQAQKMVGTAGIEQFAGFVGNLAGVNPDVLDKMDFDETVDQYGEMIGIPPHVVRSDDDVAVMRQQRLAAAQQQQQAAQMMQAAQGAKLLSETDTGGNNALNALIGGAA